MKILSLNNATTLLKSDDYNFLLDPWLVGKLYNGAWSPMVNYRNLNFLKNVNAVFISHLHEDHWDLATMELLDRDIQIYIPNIVINNLIKKKLEIIGFKNFQFIDFDTVFKIGKYFECSIIPPLNSFAQEFGRYSEGYESDATDIDTSLFVRDLKTNTNHIFLMDNTPYGLDRLERFIDVDLMTLWYPFNSYAQDYPIVYGFNKSERQKIHNQMHSKRMKAVRDCVDYLKPKYFLPHSSDFLLNGENASRFHNYIQEEFMIRKNVSLNYDFKKVKSDYGISEYLGFGDELVISNNSEIIFFRDKLEYEFNKSDFNKLEILSDISDLPIKIEKSFSLMNFRIKNFNIDISDADDWELVLKTELKEFIYSFKFQRMISQSSLSREKVLTIYLSQNLLSSLLNREIHWNSVMIGCHLSIRRVPNEYCQALYKALNFLHL